MRTTFRRAAATLLAAGLLATACGGDDADTGSASATADETASDPASATADETASAADVPDGPEIRVGSFNFPESAILANIYGQALERAGFPVQIDTDLGNRELLNPELASGNVDLVPEYVGGALSSGYGGEATGDLDETLERLRAEYEADGIVAFEPAPGEDKDVFVVTQAFADENSLTTISDLAGLDEVSLGGPPECETRETCLVGLRDVYGLDNVTFTPIGEGSVRIASLESGEIDMSLLFSTQPVITEKGFVALEDDQGITPVQNIVPVVSAEVAEAYGDALADVLDRVSEAITTDVLLELNAEVELNARNPDDVASEFLDRIG